MSHWVGVEMSDHLSSMKPKPKKKKDYMPRLRARRRIAKASRQRNR